MSNIILFKGWKVLWQTTNYMVALKQILTSGFFVCVFFLNPAICVFWCKRGKNAVLIAATSFQVYVKVVTERKYDFFIKAEETQDSIFSIEKFRPAALKWLYLLPSKLL